eukprot:5846827-Lingulodinium_polyedra.AAC.1
MAGQFSEEQISRFWMGQRGQGIPRVRGCQRALTIATGRVDPGRVFAKTVRNRASALVGFCPRRGG